MLLFPTLLVLRLQWGLSFLALLSLEIPHYQACGWWIVWRYLLGRRSQWGKGTFENQCPRFEMRPFAFLYLFLAVIRRWILRDLPGLAFLEWQSRPISMWSKMTRRYHRPLHAHGCFLFQWFFASDFCDAIHPLYLLPWLLFLLVFIFWLVQLKIYSDCKIRLPSNLRSTELDALSFVTNTRCIENCKMLLVLPRFTISAHRIRTI